VNDIGEAFAFATRLGLDPIVHIGEESSGDVIAQVADPMRLRASPVTYRRRPPRLGEHTEEVLRELGL
jgi:crotonobetainyl-CoA:carnitine CoA-transferase CaiB-like acyl-CoA transferase